MQLAILLYEGLTALDAIGPYEVLSRIPTIKVRFVAKEAGPIRVDTGYLTLHAESALADVPQPEMILLPGGTWGTIKASKDEAILDWVREAHLHTKWTTSVCTGSLILGAAGVLDGLDATTHWYAADKLAQYGATYQAERWVQQGKVITAAGVSAGIDMALWLTEQIAGRTVAGGIQLGLEYDPAPHIDSGSKAKASMAERTLSSAGMMADFAKGALKKGTRS